VPFSPWSLLCGRHRPVKLSEIDRTVLCRAELVLVLPQLIVLRELLFSVNTLHIFQLGCFHNGFLFFPSELLGFTKGRCTRIESIFRVSLFFLKV